MHRRLRLPNKGLVAFNLNKILRIEQSNRASHQGGLLCFYAFMALSRLQRLTHFMELQEYCGRSSLPRF